MIAVCLHPNPRFLSGGREIWCPTCEGRWIKCESIMPGRAGTGAQAMIVQARGLLVDSLSAGAGHRVRAGWSCRCPVIDCALVRAMVAEHGKARALAWAI